MDTTADIDIGSKILVQVPHSAENESKGETAHQRKQRLKKAARKAANEHRCQPQQRLLYSSSGPLLGNSVTRTRQFLPRFARGALQGISPIRLRPAHTDGTVPAILTLCRPTGGVRAGGPFNDAFRRGMALLQAHGLVFDRWHHPRDAESWIAEISNLAALAREFPKVTIVMDHLGGAVGPGSGSCCRIRLSDAIGPP